jgi:branched-chain amino acid transport system substrate-binding protein
VASFEKLANNDKVEVMMGGLASTISAALIEPAKKAAIPMAWTGAAASSTVEVGFKDQAFFFHYHPWDYMNATSALAFLKSTPYKTWAIVYEDGLFGTSANDGFKTTLPAQGQTIAIAESFKTGSTDFTALLNRVKASNAEGLIVVPFAGDIIPLLTQMKEVGYKPKIVYASPPSFPADFGKSPVAEGVAGLTLWTEDIPAPASKQFVADFKAKYGHTPVSYWSALAYTNLVTAVDALKKSGTGNKAGWITAMEATNYASPLGPTLKFTPSQTIKHQGFTSLVSFQWQSGKQEIVFPADLATAKVK